MLQQYNNVIYFSSEKLKCVKSTLNFHSNILQLKMLLRNCIKKKKNDNTKTSISSNEKN